MPSGETSRCTLENVLVPYVFLRFGCGLSGRSSQHNPQLAAAQARSWKTGFSRCTTEFYTVYCHLMLRHIGILPLPGVPLAFC